MLLNYALAAPAENPAFQLAMPDEDLRMLRQQSAERQGASVQQDVDLTARLIAALHTAGVELSLSLDVLAALVRSLVFLGFHRADIGEDLFEELHHWLAPALRNALIADSGRANG